MKSEISLRPEMGADILKHLRKMDDLPKKGFLAGQAVDSAITDLYGKGGGVYNDLDVFRQVPRLNKARRVQLLNSTAGRGDLELSNKSRYGGLAAVMALIDTYNIESVSRDGLVNYVNCSMAHTVGALSMHRVLSGFDINCVRVGVNLSTGLLHWDKDYEAFVHSRQLKISMMHTPWHTFLRLCKKAQELPEVFVNLEHAAVTCAALMHGQSIDRFATDGVSRLFGKKYKELADKVSDSYSPYFKLETFDAHNMGARPDMRAKPAELFYMTPKGEVDETLQQKVKALGVASIFWAPTLVEHELSTKSTKLEPKFIALQQHLNGRTGFVSTNMARMGTYYVQGQALPSVAEKVEDFVTKHPRLAGILFGRTLAQQWQAIQDLREVSVEFGNSHFHGEALAVLGLLESTASQSALASKAAIRQCLEETLLQQKASFKSKPLDARAFEGLGLTVRELRSELELLAEGKVMRHCVGGYGPRVAQGGCRILSIRSSSERLGWSTAELGRGSKGEPWRVVQHRGFANASPSKLHEKALAIVMAKLMLPGWQRHPAILPLVVKTRALKVKALMYFSGKTREFADYVRNGVLQSLFKQANLLESKARQGKLDVEVLTKALLPSAPEPASSSLLAPTGPGQAEQEDVDVDVDYDYEIPF